MCVGAAKAVITPTDAQIAGQTENYAGGTRSQFFHLGGFGFGPFNVLPSYGGSPALVAGNDPIQFSNPPARARCFSTAIVPGNITPASCDDDTWVRVLVLQAPNGGERVAFVTIDAVGAGNLIQDGLKSEVHDASCAAGACIEKKNILFGQTHSHAGADLQGLWGGVPREWINKALYTAAANAVLDALDTAKPARLVMARGYTGEFNSYRRPKIRGDEEVDLAMTALQARAADSDEVIATLLQYAAHPTAIGDDDYKLSDGSVVRVPHADYPLGAENELEETFGGTALYYNGPIADASASGPAEGPNKYAQVKDRGRRMAEFAQAFLADNAVPLDPVLSVRDVEVTLPITNPAFVALGVAGVFNGYYQFTQIPRDQIPGIDQLDPVLGPIEEARNQLPQITPVAQTQLSRISIGTPDAADANKNRLEIVTIPGEATNSFGQYIRQLAQEDAPSVVRPKTHTMLLGLTHNSFGYIIPEDEFSYIDPSGDAGFVAPFTGYEENVSLGPLTAPLLRTAGYNRLFEASPDQYLPPWLTNCQNGPSDPGCIIQILQDRLASAAEGLRNVTGIIGGGLRDIGDGCRDFGGPDAFCGGFDSLAGLFEGGGSGGGADPSLVFALADAELRGCDILDPANCLYPFPSDHYTVPAAANSPQGVNKGGTGRRVNFNILGMPRNIAGKPIDPTEWNRNDGFSPGALIMTYVPNIGTVKDSSGKPLGPITGAVPLTDLTQYTAPAAPILVLDTVTGERHPIWAEIDLNAGFLIPAVSEQASPLPKKPALLIRPATNFIEGRRYIVVLRNLKDDNNQTITAQLPFRVCRDRDPMLGQLPTLQARCDALEEKVFPLLANAGISRSSLYLAWDFTVASARNDVARLVAMRDDAFASLGDTHGSAPGDADYPAGRAPGFNITKVTENPDGANGRTVRRIQGTFTIPSYVTPADPAPLDGDTQFRGMIAQLQASDPGLLSEIRNQCKNSPIDDADPVGVFCDLFDPNSSYETAALVSLPPNRLNYVPDESSADVCEPDPAQLAGGCLAQARYGDGLPDRNPTGDLTTTFTCNIPRSAVNGAEHMDNATSVTPVRPTLYGHGLLGGHGEGNGQASDFGNRYGMMTCAADWFGFASGDIPNVASILADLSNFPVVPDGSQQGILNQLFLARLMAHPEGFAGHPKFKVGEQPVFDRREVFYHGNSQGGILGGAVVAASKDVNRGVLGVLGMNYSTLLSRSTDFAFYSIPLYLAYPDDLDRPELFSLMQMLWDRSENNGYAAHISNNAAMGGPDNAVLLHPALGDHQVTMWSADVMARTIGARVDRQRVTPARHPDTAQYALLEPIDYTNPVHAAGSALVVFDEPWLTSNDRRCNVNTHTELPPIGNVPPGAGAGNDPHECPRRDPQARCQMSNFLQRTSGLAAGDTLGRLIDPALTSPSIDGGTGSNCPQVIVTGAPGGGGNPPPATAAADYGTGLIGAVAELVADLHVVITRILDGDFAGAAEGLQLAVADLLDNLAGLPTDAANGLGTLIGLAADPQSAVQQTLAASRQAEPVILTGAQIPAWSQPAAQGAPYPYPSGAGQTGVILDPLHENDPTGLVPPGSVRDAHNGVFFYPPNWKPGDATVNNGGAPVRDIAAFVYRNGWHEIPVQVDERYPYFLANVNSDFSFYSGTDEELSYAWDFERWNPGDSADGCRAVAPVGTPDPIAGLDHDDEIVFMASDAGVMAPAGATPPGASSVQMVRLNDALNPAQERVVYLVQKAGGSSFGKHNGYVNYEPAPQADQWIDRYFFANNSPVNGVDPDPERLGSSNTGYGANLSGTVCPDGTAASKRTSADRFPRDGLTVTTEAYIWRATGRWMTREISIAKPGLPGTYGPDLIDRWKGRAFQQSPDSNISVVGFEDEQVNWEANSMLLGDRCGPVRCMREVWGADSGTNVTKTETFYRDVVTYRYRVRVHPIPPDGLYTSWDYNRSAMVPTEAEAAAGVPGGRYYTALRPQGVPIDGINDDIGQVDGFAPIPGLGCPSADAGGFVPPASNGRCPAFFDTADPSFNLTLAFNNWEQIAGKSDYGSLVYLFELKGPTSLATPLVVPYYRDDACLDDGTGDDPVPRQFPGESYTWNNGAVPKAYDRLAGRPLDYSGHTLGDCIKRQGAHGQHGIHYFATGDVDNLFVEGKPINEIDGMQWQFMVPTAKPTNVGDLYANIVRVPLQPVIVPLSAPGGSGLPQPPSGGGPVNAGPVTLDPENRCGSIAGQGGCL